MADKPLLSVGIIFKNEIRCLERCLSSIQAVKKAIPCEIVAADTGATDGSREVAEKYADTVIDFPWIGDFAAARNAVMDRCSGTWYLSMDADEWLDKDVKALVEYLRRPMQWGKTKICGVTVRNYTNYDLTGDYSDFLAIRMLRMSTGIRYVGAIHERWEGDMGKAAYPLAVILHHDGYVGFGGVQGAAKRERNMTLIRQEREKRPEDMMVRLQCIESSVGDECIAYVRDAVEGVEEKLPGWESAGPPIYRYAVNIGYTTNLPEWRDWADRALELFPDSLFTRVDIGHTLFYINRDEKNYEKAVQFGESYLDAVEKYRAENDHAGDLVFSSLGMVSENREHALRLALADIYYEQGEYRKAKAALSGLEVKALDPRGVVQCVVSLMNVQNAGADMRQVMARIWAKLDERPDAAARKEELLGVIRQTFAAPLGTGNVDGEGGACRAFVLLEGKCWAGDAATLLCETNPKRLNGILARYQDDLTALPPAAICRALRRGARFPFAKKPMTVEEMDVLAGYLSEQKEEFFALARQVREDGEAQSICWARAVVIAAVRLCPWDGGEEDVALARNFAGIEGKFLPMCYSPGALTEERVWLLPPMHRFGWYCAQAFRAQDAGDEMGYVRLLRAGLKQCGEMKPLVERLLREVERRNRQSVIHTAAPELVTLADQVKTILSRYPPDDPAVAELKASEVYKRVAWLIEDPMTVGGIAQ